MERIDGLEGKTRLHLSDSLAVPPAGFRQIQTSLAWLAFAAAEPASVPRGQVSHLAVEVARWQVESQWVPDDGSDDWTSIRREKVRSLAGVKWIWKADCENLVLKLIEILTAAGIPPGAMRLVVGELRPGDPTSGHLVLAIETVEKTLVYDCRRRGLVEWGGPELAGVAWRAATDRGRWVQIAA